MLFRIGFNPYDESYGYSTSGNLTSKAAAAYQYNATTPTGCTSGTAALKPHAAKQAGANTYGYDCAGQMVSRTVGGVNATLAWNQRGEVTSFTDPSGTTSDVYLPDGSRIMRQNPDGTRNLYLPGEELKTTLTGTGAVPVHRAGGAGVGYTSANNGAGGGASVALTKPSGAVTGDVLAAYLAVPDTTTGGVGAAPVLRGTPTATNNGTSGATTLSLTKPTAATTNDVLIGALSIPVSGSSATLEAETATLNGPITENMWCPCSNNTAVGGFDPGNNTHYIQWSYTAPTAGTYQLSFRYGAGDAAATRKLNRPGIGDCCFPERMQSCAHGHEPLLSSRLRPRYQPELTSPAERFRLMNGPSHVSLAVRESFPMTKCATQCLTRRSKRWRAPWRVIPSCEPITPQDRPARCAASAAASMRVSASRRAAAAARSSRRVAASVIE